MTDKMIVRTLLLFCLVTTGLGQSSRQPLAHVKTDNPRDTMLSFMSAMDDYRRGLLIHDQHLQDRIDEAVRTLNLEEYPRLLQQERGREAAILLKEVIDRIVVIDYERIPAQTELVGGPLLRWRLRDTEIAISRVDQGERVGEYLFSKDTVYRSREFYDKVKILSYLPDSGQGAGYQIPWYESTIPDWAKRVLWGIAVWQWLGLAAGILAGWLLNLVFRFLFRRLGHAASHSQTFWDDWLIQAIRAPVSMAVMVVLFYVSVRVTRLEGSGLAFFIIVIRIWLGVSCIWLSYNIMEVLAQYWLAGPGRNRRAVDEHLLHMLQKALKVVVIIFGILILLQNLSVNVFSLLAGLGIGGLAIALAAKDAVANFFGSMMILLDRPFQVGEWIIIGDAEGTVEEIGFRSTRIRTFYNSVITVPNSELMNAKIDNMGRRQFIRIKSRLRLQLQTPPDKVDAFITGVRTILHSRPSIVTGKSQVALFEIGADFLDIILVFFLTVDAITDELGERQAIFLEIMALAQSLGVEFARPIWTLSQSQHSGLSATPVQAPKGA
jgi:MscS family membrane protein